MLYRFGMLVGLLLLFAVPALAQEGGLMLPVLAGEAGGRLELWAGDTRTIITEENTYQYGASFSPDGTKLAYTLSASRDNPFDANRRIMVYDGAQHIELVTAYLMTGMPISWTLDGQILYAVDKQVSTEMGAQMAVYVIRPEAGAQPDLIIDNLAYGVGCGGGSSIPMDHEYWQETSFGGSPDMLQLTDYGLVHTSRCVGAKTSLTRPFSGETVSFAGEQLVRAKLAPDGQKLAGIILNYDDPTLNSLVVIDLATLEESSYGTAGSIAYVTWTGDGQLIYATRDVAGNLLAGLNADQIKLFNDAIGAIEPQMTEFPQYSTSIYRLNLATGEEQQLYTATAYSVQRLTVVDNYLLFSEVSSGEAWLRAILDGTVRFENNFDGGTDYVTVALRMLDWTQPEAGAVTIADDFQQFAAAGAR